MSIILLAGDNIAETERTIAGLLSHPKRATFEFVFVNDRSNVAAHEVICALARRHTVRLLLAHPDVRLDFSRHCNLGARAARGRLLLFADSGSNNRSTNPLAAFAAALDNPAVGLVGVNTLWQQQRLEPKPRSSNRNYQFSSIPLNGFLFGIRPEIYWAVGGLDESFKSPSIALADLQYRLIGANYRLARALTPGPRKTSASLRQHRIGIPDKLIPRTDLERFSRKHRRPLAGLNSWKELFTRHPYPMFSVSIATRNYGQWLPRCLNSVLRNQKSSRAPLQITVVDDCSTDNTRLLLEEYRKKYPGVFSLIRPATSRGISAVKNAAIRRCTGEYVALLDADDEFLPEKLARCEAALKAKPKADFLTHDYRFIDAATGETFIPGDEWYGKWRPPGVWVFRSGRVSFSEQMICGYEELEWSKRHWRRLRKVHIPEPLVVVHGEHVADRWKFDRAVAGSQASKRWRPEAKTKRGHRVFACRACGGQYFEGNRCCGRQTEEVPLVCYMAVSSIPYSAPVEFSIVIFTADSLTATQKLCAALQEDPEVHEAEWIFVQCHPRRDLLNYLRELSQTARVKAIFAPNRDEFVYGHDVNRAARVADGKYLVFLANNVEPRPTGSLSTVRAALSNLQVGIVGPSPAQRNTGGPTQGQHDVPYQFTAGPVDRRAWAIRQDVFWELGAMDEGFESEGMETVDLQYRALKGHYRLARSSELFTSRNADEPPAMARADRALFREKHACAYRRKGMRVEPFAGFRPVEVSIVIATQNEARLLPRCLDSVLRSKNLTGLDFQIVVVNDCSTDDTRLILERYRQRYPENFTLLHRERSGGIAAAWNLGFRRASGRYIAGLEGKAQFANEKLHLCRQRMEQSGADLLFHDWAWLAKQTCFVDNAAREPPGDAPPVSTCFWRNGVVSLNEQLFTAAGYPEWFRRWAPQLQLAYLPRALTFRQRLRRNTATVTR